MLWNEYFCIPRVQLLFAVRLLSVHVLLDGLPPINNAIDISQTICCFGPCNMHACMLCPTAAAANVPQCLDSTSSVP